MDSYFVHYPLENAIHMKPSQLRVLFHSRDSLTSTALGVMPLKGVISLLYWGLHGWLHDQVWKMTLL